MAIKAATKRVTAAAANKVKKTSKTQAVTKKPPGPMGKGKKMMKNC